MPVIADVAKVFLSHSSRDKPAVEVIKGLLERGELRTGERPIPCWFDKDDLRSKGTWVSQLEDSLAACGAAVVFYGPDGHGPVHKYEIDLLLKRAMYEQGGDAIRLVIVLLPGVQESAIQGFVSLHMWADFRKGLDDAAALQRLRAFILGEAPRSGPGDDPKFPKPEIEPYRGLEPFEGEHASYFFGRDHEIKELCECLQQWPFTAVIGGSGSGKSSIVRAGLQTELATRERPALAVTTTITIRPGSNPIRTLADQVVASLPEQSISVTERFKLVEDFELEFRANSEKLLDVLRTLYPKDSQHVLLVIDQFEELFTHSTVTRCDTREVEAAEPHQQMQFVELLAAVAKSQQDRLRIVITLRADFFDRCLSLPTLKSLVENRTLLMGKLSGKALRMVIEAPAFKVGAYFEKGLVGRILKDVENQNGSLPLLQHALKELWEQRRFGFLTDEGYDQTGGVEGALKKRADATLRSIEPNQREIAKNIFLRLTTLGEGVSDTRRRVQKNELYPEKTDSHVIDDVLKDLSSQANRLIVMNDDGTVEVTHEALIQRWDTLKGWLAENRDDKRLHDQLREAANEWADPKHKRNPTYPEGGRRLELAEKFNQTRSNILTVLEREFLMASIAKREQAKRLRRRFTQVGFALTASATVASMVALWQFSTATQATQRLLTLETKAKGDAIRNGEKIERQQAEANRENANFSWRYAADARDANEPLKAALLFLRGANSLAQIAPTHKSAMDTNAIRIHGLAAHTVDKIVTRTWIFDSQINGVLFSKDGMRVLTWGGDVLSNRGRAQLWNLTDLDPLQTFEHDFIVNGARFSTDEAHLLTWGNSKAKLWDVTKPHAVQTFKHDNSVNGALLSRDGLRVLSWSGDLQNKKGEARLWDVTQSEPLQTFKHDNRVNGAEFSRDETRVLTWSTDGTSKLWEVTNPEPLQTFKHNSEVFGGKFSRDESHVLTWSFDCTARHWDVTIPEPLQTFKHDNKVNGAQFNRDESRVLTWSMDMTARLWDLNKPEPLQTFKHEGDVTGALFSSDESLLLSWTNDLQTKKGEAKLWDVTKPVPIQTFKHDDWINAATFSPDESQVATWGGQGSYKSGETRIWDVKRSIPLLVLKHHGSVKGAFFTQDGSCAMTWNDDRFGNKGEARLWDLTKAKPIKTFKHNSDLGASQPFSTDESRLLITSNESHILTWSNDLQTKKGEARLWDMTKPSPIQTFKHDHWLGAAKFSPNELLVLTWGGDMQTKKGEARLWDLTKSESLRTFRHNDQVNGAHFSRDASRVLTWGCDRTARLWDVGKTEPLQTFKHDGNVWDAHFSRDELRVLTCDDSSAWLWDVTKPEPLQKFTSDGGVTRGQFSRDESQVLIWNPTATSAYLWDIVRLKPLHTFRHAAAIKGVAFDRKGASVLTWSYDHTARLWNVTNGELIQTFKHVSDLNGAQFNRDESRVLTWSYDHTAILWDVTKPEPLQIFKHDNEVFGVQLSRDESRLLTWCGERSSNLGVAKLWDVTKPEPLQTFKHDGPVKGAQFSHDESRVLSWGDSTVRLWDITDPLVTLNSQERILELEVRSGNTLDEQLNLRTLQLDEWQTKIKSAEFQAIKKTLPLRSVRLESAPNSRTPFFSSSQ